MNSIVSHRPTSADVARHAGVSRATVSYVLNDSDGGRIRPETRERVLAAARDLGYVPSHAGRALASGRSDLVLLVLPSAPLCPPRQRFVEGLGAAVQAGGLTLAIHWRTAEPDALAQAVARLAVGAVVAIAPLDSAQEQLLVERGLPLLVLDAGEGDDLSPAVAQLRDPVGEVGRLQARVHLDAGRRRLVCAVPVDSVDDDDVRHRWDAIVAAAAEAGAPAPVVVRLPVVTRGLAATVTSGALVRALAEQVPDLGADEPLGLCCDDDTQALALLADLAAAGVPVPGRVAVVGVGGSALGALCRPTLATVAVDAEAAAEFAALAVQALLDGTAVPRPQREVLIVAAGESA